VPLCLCVRKKMNQIVNRLIIGCVLILGLSQPLWAQRDVDQVYLTKGTPARGSIPPDGITPDKVAVEVASAPRHIEVNEIVRIAFAGEPTELLAGRNAVLQKNYNQALIDLKKLDGQKIDRAFVRQDIEFYKALCQAKIALSEGGDKKAATDAMYNFVKSSPKSYHFYEAAEALGDLAMASGRWADAAKFYGPTGLGAAPWSDYQMRANYATGRALIGEKKYDEALEKFKAVQTSELSTPEALRQKNLAAVGRAVCLAETGKVEEAQTLLNDLIDKNDPQDAVLFARAYNALGRCYEKQNKAKDAVLALLHTDLLFYADADAHAEALYHLSKLWSDINKSDRAIAARSTLRERYAGSIWATLE
jgi:tetratricopeptide (TPR) repeat protein